mgnify:CR=1 FL=1
MAKQLLFETTYLIVYFGIHEKIKVEDHAICTCSIKEKLSNSGDSPSLLSNIYGQSRKSLFENGQD